MTTYCHFAHVANKFSRAGPGSSTCLLDRFPAATLKHGAEKKKHLCWIKCTMEFKEEKFTYNQSRSGRKLRNRTKTPTWKHGVLLIAPARVGLFAQRTLGWFSFAAVIMAAQISKKKKVRKPTKSLSGRHLNKNLLYAIKIYLLTCQFISLYGGDGQVMVKI